MDSPESRPRCSSQPRVALNAESQHALERAAVRAAGGSRLDVGRVRYESAVALQTFPEQASDGPFYSSRSPILNISRVRVPDP